MFRQSIAIVFVGLVLFCQTALADQHGEDVLSKFTETLNGRKLPAEVATKIQSILADNVESPDTAITESLIAIYPEFGLAIDDADFEDLSTAVAALTPLTNHEDRFLAADASFYLARTLMNGEKYEAAVPLLKSLTGELGEHSAHRGVAQYYTGVAQAGLLENKKSIKSFVKFLEFNPDSAERLIDNARTQVLELQQVEQGKLSDVRQRMDFSRRRLQLTETDDETQNQQQKIVTMLGKLIKEEEKKEASQQQQQSGKPDKKKEQGENSDSNQKQGQQQPGKPNQSKSQNGSSSSQANGVAQVKTYDGSPASPWSRLRDRNRDAANNAFKDKLPARYRELVEKYNEKADGED